MTNDSLIIPLTRRESNWVLMPRTEVRDSRAEGDHVAVYDVERYGRVVHAMAEATFEGKPLRAGAYQILDKR